MNPFIPYYDPDDRGPKLWELLLSVLAPVRLPKLIPEPDTIPGEASPDPYHTPVTEDGVLWRAYDVRQDGIERFRR